MTSDLRYSASKLYALADALLERQRQQTPPLNPHDPLVNALMQRHGQQTRALNPRDTLVNALTEGLIPRYSAGPLDSTLLTDALAGAFETQKRKAYFAFHFDDVMRVNNVRKAFKRTFYDSSLWESRKLADPEAIKRLIREGVEYTSSVCVLIGTHTWCRRWVRYEMARAVIDKRGLLGVHINGLNHHGRLHADALGINPLDQMAVGKVLANAFAVPQYYLFEWGAQGSWVRYQDHQLPIVKPSYLLDPPPGYLIQLSTGAKVYDFDRQDGPANIGSWIDYAAQQVRR